MTANRYPLCDVCGSEVDLDESVTASNTSEKYTKYILKLDFILFIVRFMNETQPIVELLKQTEKFAIPE